MDHQIISIADIRRSAAQAFAGRAQPAVCRYAEGSSAHAVWLEEYRQLYAAWTKTQEQVAA